MRSGLDRVAGDSRLYANLLIHFARHGQGTLDDLEDALRHQEAERLRLLVHKLKGVAGNLGAECLQREASQLEHLADTPDSLAARQSYESLGACLQDLSQRILEKLERWSDSSQSSTSVANLSVDLQLQTLLRQLQEFDGGALESWSQLSGKLHGHLSQQQISQLDELISNFDFPSARMVLGAGLI